MKKIVFCLILSVLLVSCYKDYVKDYKYNTVYFAFQNDVRTLVVGEGMKIDIGVAFGGAVENNSDRSVNFEIQNTLLTPALLSSMKNSGLAYIKNAMTPVASLLPLPANYFSLSDNSKFTIKKGKYTGSITLKPDSSKFLSDANTLSPNYALALHLVSADADTILASKDYEVVGLKYENMLFGNYWHGGVTTVKDGSGNVIQTIKYVTKINDAVSKAWILKTVEPFALTTNGYSDVASSPKQEFKITLNGSNVTVSSFAGATYAILPNGPSTYNQAKLLQNRKIFLSYKYQNSGGNWCYAQDTLTFRNRIRDGVNEWMDEDPSHY